MELYDRSKVPVTEAQWEGWASVWDSKFRREGETWDEDVPVETEFLVDGLIPLNRVVMLASAPKKGKTAFATALALSVAEGTPFLGRKVAQGPVLWFAMEETRAEREAMLRLRPGPAEGRDLYTCWERVRLDTMEGLLLLRHWLYKIKPRLIVVDPLYEATGPGTLQDCLKVRAMVRAMRRHIEKVGTTMLMIHHLTKSMVSGQDPRAVAESIQLQAAVSMTMHLTTHTVEGERRVVVSTVGRGGFANQTVNLTSAGPLEYEVSQVETRSAFRGSVTERKILAAIRAGCETAKEIAAREGLVVGTTQNALTRMVNRGMVQRRPGNGEKQYSAD